MSLKECQRLRPQIRFSNECGTPEILQSRLPLRICFTSNLKLNNHIERRFALTLSSWRMCFSKLLAPMIKENTVIKQTLKRSTLIRKPKNLKNQSENQKHCLKQIWDHESWCFECAESHGSNDSTTFINKTSSIFKMIRRSIKIWQFLTKNQSPDHKL